MAPDIEQHPMEPHEIEQIQQQEDADVRRILLRFLSAEYDILLVPVEDGQQPFRIPAASTEGDAELSLHPALVAMEKRVFGD